MAPVIAPFYFDESVFYGEGVQVMCHVPKGDTPLTFVWTFSSGDVSALAGVNIMNVGDRGTALIIPSVTAIHSGNYSCTVSNAVASAVHYTMLNVKGTMDMLIVFLFRLHRGQNKAKQQHLSNRIINTHGLFQLRP